MESDGHSLVNLGARTVLQGAFVDFTTYTNFTKLLFVRQIRHVRRCTFCFRRRHFVVGSCQNESRPAAEAEKLIDNNDIIGNSSVDRPRQISGVNPYCN
jgi:hypothetical protein